MGPTSMAPDEILLFNNTLNKWDFVILGADGQQGLITSKYLVDEGYRVVCVDLYIENVKEQFKNSSASVHILQKDCTCLLEFETILQEYKPKVVINLTYQESLPLVKVCIRNKINFLDIFANLDWVMKFFGVNDQTTIDELSKKNNVAVITGCGCAPGISSMLAKKLDGYFETVSDVEVGFSWDSNIKQFVPPFCISDAAEELFFQTRVIKNGEDSLIEPLSIQKQYNFPLIGKQTVYAICHIELYTLKNLFEKKGVKDIIFFGGFPEHCFNILKALKDLNLVENKLDLLQINTEAGCYSFTKQQILNAISKQCKFFEGYTESEIVWCTVRGQGKNLKLLTKTMLCKVPPIPGWEKYGCNVDTGIPAAIIAKMLHKDLFAPGAHTPEMSVPEDLFFKGLEQFGFEFIIQDTL